MNRKRIYVEYVRTLKHLAIHYIIEIRNSTRMNQVLGRKEREPVE